MSPMDYAIKLEQTLFEKQEKPFQSKTAKIYLDEFDKLKLISENSDIYDLLESDEVATQLDESDLAVLVVTTGWASPRTNDDEDDVRPSEHPKRRRVRLSIYANRLGEVASIIRFEDDPNEITTDEGKATGSLADAISALMGSR
jgi:hypothetical protein